MNRYLIDTHVWLWLQSAPSRLASQLLDQLSDDSNDLLLSAASSWEISIKYGLGKLPLPEPPHLYVPDRMRRSGRVLNQNGQPVTDPAAVRGNVTLAMREMLSQRLPMMRRLGAPGPAGAGWGEAIA